MEDETCKNESSGSASTSNEKSKYFAHPQAKAKKLQEKPDSGQHQVGSKKSFPVKKSNEPDVSDQGSELLYDSWVSLKGSSLHLYIQSQLVRIIVIKKS